VKTIEVQLDDATYERLSREAAKGGHTPAAWLSQKLSESIAPPPARENRTLGLFADDADLIEQVTRDIMQSRERRWVR
jgi:hypothetical protein